MPPELFGPLGLTIAAVAAVVVLWKLHLDADKRDRDRGDRAINLLDLSLQNNRDAIAASAQRDANEAARSRRTDP